MEVVCRHLAANCNPKPNVVRFLDPQTLIFAFSNSLALYSLSANQILLSLHDTQRSHNRLNCVAVVPLQPPLILCGYDSHFLAGFTYQQDAWGKAFEVEESGGLISIEILRVGSTYHVFTNNDASVVSHYVMKDLKLSLSQQLKFSPHRIVETISCHHTEDSILLFLGGADQQIHFYQAELSECAYELTFKFSLSGHEDAVTKLCLTQQQEGGDLLLASSSKDGYVRIWRITTNHQVLKFHKNVRPLLTNHHILLEAVLAAHDCSVTSLTWARFGNTLQLISASLDCTLCVWTNQDEPWTIETRLGQLLGNKNAYFEVIADPAFEHLVALNYTGALLIWRWSEGKWTIRESCNGHANQVKAIEWNHTGDFLVSTSKDQTTRVVARSRADKNYHEISRAQIHGYDINALTLLKIKDQTLDLIVCGADEKVIRVLQPPACFANFLNSHTRAILHLYFPSEPEEARFRVSKPEDPVLLYEAYSEGGTQVLGLMAKMQRVEKDKITNYYEEDEGGPVTTEAEQPSTKSSPAILDFCKSPHEDYLVKHTLWPEMAKLYGHPHEIHTLCRSSSSRVLASSCKALSKESASIILWSVGDWKILKILPVHNYTVNGMEFSPNDKYFASASKDRQLVLFSHDFQLIYSYEAHLRAVTCLSFHLSEDLLLTGSRDKTLKLHSVPDRQAVAELNLKQPISAVAFCRLPQRQDHFAVGCVSGDVFLGVVEKGQLQLLRKIEAPHCHSRQINSLKWNGALLATCSDDFSVRIFEVLFERG